MLYRVAMPRPVCFRPTEMPSKVSSSCLAASLCVCVCVCGGRGKGWEGEGWESERVRVRGGWERTRQRETEREWEERLWYEREWGGLEGRGWRWKRGNRRISSLSTLVTAVIAVIAVTAVILLRSQLNAKISLSFKRDFENDHSKLRILVDSRLENQRTWRFVLNSTITLTCRRVL